MTLSDKARAVIESGALAHFVTINPNGSPQVAIVWTGMEDQQNLVRPPFHNPQKPPHNPHDPRVPNSFETGRTLDNGLDEYLVVEGEARVTEGGAPELLQRL